MNKSSLFIYVIYYAYNLINTCQHIIYYPIFMLKYLALMSISSIFATN